ncbi:ImmA/IrrE family metallo-endopeptidase [Arthrobacter sp. NPDC080073]|uniref:ImmA/IrrE family metallo-endopeptidase n=1 Tax=Arthrobacter sp. NPDC080073 TaxID=3155919 RepID=UPI003435278E
MRWIDSLGAEDVCIWNTEKTATEALREFVVDEEQRFRPPIDPSCIAHDLGVEVRYISAENSLSGFVAKEQEDVPAIIYVNDSHSAVRQRFTIAHELGHYIQETARGKKTFQTLKRLKGHSDQGTDEKERWANGFAAALLMPAGATKRLYASGETVREMAERFGVSTLAMEYRLANLGVA